MECANSEELARLLFFKWEYERTHFESFGYSDTGFRVTAHLGWDHKKCKAAVEIERFYVEIPAKALRLRGLEDAIKEIREGKQ